MHKDSVDQVAKSHPASGVVGVVLQHFVQGIDVLGECLHGARMGDGPGDLTVYHRQALLEAPLFGPQLFIPVV